MIKVIWQYVSPIEVENVLIEHETVLEAAVIGTTSADGLTKTTAYVVLRPEYEPSDEIGATLQTYVKEHLAPFKYPRRNQFIDELPKTAKGNIKSFRLHKKDNRH